MCTWMIGAGGFVALVRFAGEHAKWPDADEVPVLYTALAVGVVVGVVAISSQLIDELRAASTTAKRQLLVALAGALALVGLLGAVAAFAFWVWPTPYRYVGAISIRGSALPARVHRITGCAEFLYPDGWGGPKCSRLPR